MPPKTLAAKAAANYQPPAPLHRWEGGELNGLINNLQTTSQQRGEGRGGPGAGSLVSGMPSVFARPILFERALVTDPERAAHADGLNAIYAELVGEWRGLLACIALRPDELSVHAITLAYSDGLDLTSTRNIFEPKGAFGNMLFGRKARWADDDTQRPVIHVIRWGHGRAAKVIGGCSPDCLVFTSAAYRLDAQEPFIKDGRLSEPKPDDLNLQQLASLIGYLEHLDRGMMRFENSFAQEVRKNMSPVTSQLQKWRKELEAHARIKAPDLKGSAPDIDIFDDQGRYAELLGHSTDLFVTGGTAVTATASPTAVAIRLNKVLLPKGSKVVRVKFPSKDFKPETVHLLKAVIKGGIEGETAYFALPLSEDGLFAFGTSLDQLLDERPELGRPSLSAVLDQDKLTVRLDLTIHGANPRPVRKEETYQLAEEQVNRKDLLVWPDFVANHWTKYFFFNELPHNATSGVRMTPLVAARRGELDVQRGDDLGARARNFIVAAEGGKATFHEGGPRPRLHVRNRPEMPAAYPYELLECDTPFLGAKVSIGSEKDPHASAGFVMLRIGGTRARIKPIKDDDVHQEEYHVTLGVDFGSTNTSVSFCRKDGTPETMKLVNRRVSFFADDSTGTGGQSFARQNEIFFFQNEPVMSNGLRSVLTLHDEARITQEGETVNATTTAREIGKGGFACFEKNLPIEDSRENRIVLGYDMTGDGQDAKVRTDEVLQVFNMKWDDADGNSHKAAYLSSVLLHIHAHMFGMDGGPLVVKRLNWSYPSAMPIKMIYNYQDIWDGLHQVRPVQDAQLTVARCSPAGNHGDSGAAAFDFVPLSEKRSATAMEALTESCAVANYLVNSERVDRSPHALTLCFDVGGSTTDITALCMMNGRHENGDPFPGFGLVKQSSIRFAAQRVSAAVGKVPEAQKALLSLCDELQLSLRGLNSRGRNTYKSGTASLFYEQLVDMLDKNGHETLYRKFAAHCPRLFWVDLYVTGLIVYYAGMLARKLQDELATSPERLTPNEPWQPRIEVSFAGKGSRIFDWYQTVNPAEARRYRMSLFRQGYGSDAEPRVGDIQVPIEHQRDDIKFEVSKGLAAPMDRLMVPRNPRIMELVGEDGLRTGDRMLNATDTITGTIIEGFDTGSTYPDPQPGTKPAPRFAAFLRIFRDHAAAFGFTLTDREIDQTLADMRLGAYIKQQKEFQRAKRERQNDKPFDYIAPIIILEGMKFLEDVLERKLGA